MVTTTSRAQADGWHDVLVNAERTPGGAPLGELVIQRGDDVLGALIPLKVFVDDTAVVGLMPNRTVALQLAQGEHRVRAGRSLPVTVSVTAGSRTFVLASHPPLPGRWRLLISPVRATRPTVEVRSSHTVGPGPGEPTAVELHLNRRLASLISFDLASLVVLGCLFFVTGVTVAVLWREAGVLVLLPSAVALLGLVTAAVGIRVRRRAVGAPGRIA
ncbi:MAG TPA: hypothetical protein VGK35_12970 [Actinotalea sp.]|jgi:hypothetical protein